MARKTLNDKAWEKIFSKYDILEKVNNFGFYEIPADNIREFREPRLMAKFDHRNNLPKVMADNNLSILPLSAQSYTIGDFELFKEVNYDINLKPQKMSLPAHLDTIKPTDLYSESSALHCAYLSGMVDDFLGERSSFTVSGRMRSKDFNYNVLSSVGTTKKVSVQGAQIEIDGAYEGYNDFMIVEAKKQKVNDFNIRQMYYPYRVWTERTNKHIRPIFFTVSNDTFHFFEYKFENLYTYNSLVLVRQKDYIIDIQSITQQDVNELAMRINDFVPEPEVPFPQADDFTKVIDLLSYLYEEDLTKDDIAEQLDFDIRQSDYYYNSCLYLELATKYLAKDGKIYASLNKQGREIMQLSFKEKRLKLAKKILKHKVFKEVYDKITENEGDVDNEFIVEKMRQSDLYNINSDSTFYRRASTIRGWAKWVYNLPN